MDEKICLVAFNPDPMCFMHVLINALDMHERGNQVAVVIEGGATALIDEIRHPEHPVNGFYERVKFSGLIDGVCKACSNKMGSLKAVREEELPLLDSLYGHPSLQDYIDEGYRIITM